MEKLLLIVEVHQLKKQGFKVAAIAKKLEISRNTVYKYLDMTFPANSKRDEQQVTAVHLVIILHESGA